jgi:hypothetical protein
MWLELVLIVAAITALSLLVDAVHGVPGLVLGLIGSVLSIGLYWRCGVWAERVARRKNIYHPQYFVLGPIGLVMALCTRRP